MHPLGTGLPWGRNGGDQRLPYPPDGMDLGIIFPGNISEVEGKIHGLDKFLNGQRLLFVQEGALHSPHLE